MKYFNAVFRWNNFQHEVWDWKREAWIWQKLRNYESLSEKIEQGWKKVESECTAQKHPGMVKTTLNKPGHWWCVWPLINSCPVQFFHQFNPKEMLKSQLSNSKTLGSENNSMVSPTSSPPFSEDSSLKESFQFPFQPSPHTLWKHPKPYSQLIIRLGWCAYNKILLLQCCVC